jgi:hypothetical protein
LIFFLVGFIVLVYFSYQSTLWFSKTWNSHCAESRISLSQC